MKKRDVAGASTHKKVAVLLFGHAEGLKGYANSVGVTEGSIEILSTDGEHQAIAADTVKAVHFLRDLSDGAHLERKTFLSRPKLDGLWVKLRFRDGDVIEGMTRNDLLDLLDSGIQLTPPDLHGNVMRVFVPRSALAELTVLGVVGAARRGPRRDRGAQAEADIQPKLFED